MKCITFKVFLSNGETIQHSTKRIYSKRKAIELLKADGYTPQSDICEFLKPRKLPDLWINGNIHAVIW